MVLWFRVCVTLSQSRWYPTTTVGGGSGVASNLRGGGRGNTLALGVVAGEGEGVGLATAMAAAAAAVSVFTATVLFGLSSKPTSFRVKGLGFRV